MKIGKGWLQILCLAVVFVFGFAGEVYAIDLLDGKLRLHGFLKNETGVRLKDRVWYDAIITNPNNPFPSSLPAENARQKENKLSVMRSTLLIDGEYDISDALRFGFIFRTYYDAKWDLDSSIDFTAEDHEKDLQAEPNGEHLETDVDLREWHIQWDLGNFRIKAGRQQIVWGEADAIRISDIINPLDFSKDFTTTAYGLDWEDVRIPQRMIDMGLAMSGPRHGVLKALKSSATGSILWLRANGSATLFYTGYSVPSQQFFRRQRTWANFTIRD